MSTSCPSCRATVGVGAQKCQQCGQSMSAGALIAAAYPKASMVFGLVCLGFLGAMYLKWCW